jgi:Bacterial archaeo-eukaryotic release factor family 7
MDLFRRDELKELLTQPREPCVSFFLPTQRGGGEQNPIRWKNLVRQAGDDLEAYGLRTPAVRELLLPTWDLLEDPTFWKHQSDGLACFLAPAFIRSFRLPAAFPDLAVVGRRFHLKPLLPLLSGDGRFYVLAISQNAVRLFHGTRYCVSEVDLKGAPWNLAEALLTHDRDEPLVFHTHPALGYGRGGAIFHGHGVGIDDHKDDLLRYFQQVDRGLHELLREERAPLVLAAVEYLWPIYREANRYPHLLELGIPGNPDHLSARELHDRAWAVVQPRFAKAKEDAASLYRQFVGTGRTSDDLEEIVREAHGGRVEQLFVAGDGERWGTFDPTQGRVAVHDRQEPGDEDLLSRAAADTMLHGGTAYVVGSQQVPGHRFAAALFWLPSTRRKK